MNRPYNEPMRSTVFIAYYYSRGFRMEPKIVEGRSDREICSQCHVISLHIHVHGQ